MKELCGSNSNTNIKDENLSFPARAVQTWVDCQQPSKELDKQGKAQVYCLEGVASQIPGMVDSEKSADRIIAIDGCSVGCAMEGLSRAGVPIHQAVMVTDLEIERK